MFDHQAGPDTIQSQLFIYNCILCASFVILYYDYALTFLAEYRRYWTAEQKFMLAHLLFYLNRYVTILGHIPVILLYFWTWSESNRLQTCLQINHYNEYLIVVIQVIVGCISILRTYALYARSRRILILLCGVTLAATVYGLHSLLILRVDTYTLSDLPSTGCLLPVSDDMTKGISQAWIGHLFFDALVFGLTLYKSLRSTRPQGFTILAVMMRDGTMYFGVMVLAAISVVLSFRVFPPYLRGMTATLTNVLSSTMISRLMLNLRDPNLGSQSASKAHPSAVMSHDIVFNHDIDTQISWSKDLQAMGECTSLQADHIHANDRESKEVECIYDIRGSNNV